MLRRRKPLPEALVAPFRQTPQQRERSRLGSTRWAGCLMWACRRVLVARSRPSRPGRGGPRLCRANSHTNPSYARTLRWRTTSRT
jgi:hypothetical protein